MRAAWGSVTAAAFAVAALGGCSAIPAEPVRIIDARSEVSACRSLGTLGPPVRTDRGGVGQTEADGDFGGRLQAMREAAFGLGATDLLLVRRPYRDWSFVQGVAYRCRR